MDYFILSLVLLAIGVYGLVTNYRLLKIVISIEILAVAATMNFVLLVAASGRILGESFLILAFSTDICVSSIVVALLIMVSRRYGTTDIRELARLVEQQKVAEDTEQLRTEGN